jgi:cobalt transporter subunit CbtA
MLKRLGTSAVFAGFAAGLIAALLQLLFVVPVILEAELYETGTLVHFGTAAGHDQTAGEAGHDHAETEADHDHAETEAGHDHAAPVGGDVNRHLLTVLATTATYIGFGLLMTAAFALAERRGHAVTARAGLVWGLCGFLAVQLLPAAGLAPELPGAAAADLTARQVWWAGTALASAAGLAAIAFGRGWPVWVPAVLLILAPHLVGAPHPEVLAGVVPPELSAEFAGRALAIAAAGWAMLGLFAGHFWQREAGQ